METEANQNQDNKAQSVLSQKQDWRNYSTGSGSTMAKEQPAKESRRPERRGNGLVFALIFFSLLIGAGGATVGVIALINSNKSKTPETVSVGGYYSGNSAEFEQSSIAEIASKVTPAVVSIISEVQNNSYYSFYGASTSQASGTGMIVSKDGYILTNKHVVEDAKKLEVVTDSGDTYDDVDIVGVDPLNDVAFIKINGVDNLPTVTLGDSKTISVGQPVLAIGNALGAYQNTVTEGIVSGTGRSLVASDSNGANAETLTDMIQTDAAINPGNSGGPLVNAVGDVIGLNTAVSSSANGIGFAIPIAAAKGMLRSILDSGKASRAYVGVNYVTVTPEVAKRYKLSVSHGAYIHSESRSGNAVIADGPADKAGLKDGDIITKIGDVEVGRAGSVTTLIGEYKSGETIEITYLRDGETKTATLTLGDYEK